MALSLGQANEFDFSLGPFLEGILNAGFCVFLRGFDHCLDDWLCVRNLAGVGGAEFAGSLEGARSLS